MSKGVLYVVATPIGNLEDFTPRAITTLKQVPLIAAEDTRHSSRLMSHFDIGTRLIALHDHNESSQIQALMAHLDEGHDLALISDAGTPLISDPGYRVVAAAQAAGFKVVPIPGSCAAIAALSAAGLASDRFIFEGFLPAKQVGRSARLKALSTDTRTLIFYEAPHRIVESLQDMADVFGVERRGVIAREVTKTFETIRQMPLGELAAWVASDANQQRGEIVVLVEGAPADAGDASEAEGLRVLKILMKEMPLKPASQLAAEITGLKKNALYELGLKLKESN